MDSLKSIGLWLREPWVLGEGYADGEARFEMLAQLALGVALTVVFEGLILWLSVSIMTLVFIIVLGFFMSNLMLMAKLSGLAYTWRISFTVSLVWAASTMLISRLTVESSAVYALPLFLQLLLFYFGKVVQDRRIRRWNSK